VNKTGARLKTVPLLAVQMSVIYMFRLEETSQLSKLYICIIPATRKRITITEFGSIGGACTYIYSVTPNPGKQAFLNSYIENLCMYHSNLKVFPGKVLLPTIHGKI